MYVKFVRGGNLEEHYLRWSKSYQVNLDWGFKVVGEFREGPHEYWRCEAPKNWNPPNRPQVVHLAKCSFKGVVLNKSLEEYM